MTISTEVRKAGPFVGNGSASVFPFAFKVFKAADLIVVRRQDNIGEETTLVLDSDYHVTLNGNQDTTPGGVVTLVGGALASGFTLVVSSELPYLQPTDLTNQGGFYPKVITNALDRLTIFCQQLAEITGRTLKLPITAPTNISAEIPLPNPSELIAWDETGTKLTTISPQSLVTSIAYGSATADLFAGDGATTTFPLSTNPASVNNLDVSVGGFSQRPVQGGIGDYSWNGGASITFAEPPPAPTVPGDKNVLVRYMQAIPVSDSEALHAQTREALRRSYADAGYNLVEGSFETGGTLTSTADVLLLESAGTAYAWTGAYPVGGYDVAPGIDPTVVPGYVPRSDVLLRYIAQTGVADISELVSFSDKSSSVYMHEFHAGSGIGGGLFRWNGSASKTLHDGGSYIDPAKALPDWSSESSVAAWLTASLSGVGVWERVHESREIDAAWFGILPQNSTTQISSKSQLLKLFGIITGASTGLDTRLVCKFPSGTYYTTDTLTVDRAFFIDYKFDGFELKFTDTATPTGDAVIIFNSPVQCSFDGSHIINANNKTKYAIAYDRATGSGTSGGFSSGLVTMNAQWQVRISAPDTTTLFSEFTFSNYRSYGCKNGMHASGYNTVVTVNGASLVSVLDPADPTGLDSCTILVEGATVNVAGGELVRPGTTTGNLINIRPSSNGKYGNVRVSGAHIETSAPLANISNPDAYALNASVGGLTVVGCGGYTGGSTTASFITTEPNFDGVVSVKACDFYRDTLSVARIIDAQGPCRHDIDSGTWDGFTHIKWGGIDVSSANPTLTINGLPSATIPSGDTVLKFQTESLDAQSAYLASLHDPATGKFTVPPYGPYDVDVDCIVFVPGVSGNLSVMAGAALLALTDIGASGAGHISALLRGLNSGTEITVHIQSSTPSSGSSFVAALNQLNITARATV